MNVCRQSCLLKQKCHHLCCLSTRKITKVRCRTYEVSRLGGEAASFGSFDRTDCSVACAIPESTRHLRVGLRRPMMRQQQSKFCHHEPGRSFLFIHPKKTSSRSSIVSSSLLYATNFNGCRQTNSGPRYEYHADGPRIAIGLFRFGQDDAPRRPTTISRQ